MFYASAPLQQIVGGEHILGIVVLDVFERRILSVLGALALADRIGDLHIAVTESVVAQDEVAFKLA